MQNILDLDIEELKIWMKEHGENSYRARQVFEWIYNNVWDFNEMKNISKVLQQKLISAFYIEIPKNIKAYISEKDDTTKFLLEYKDGNIIETVVMKYKHGYSICVSTQVGCSMGCKFCASTKNGLVRNLTSGEILGQVLRSQQELSIRISNVVLMGSGEPLNNYNNVIKFINTLNAEYGLNIGQRHITLSTCGITPNIIRLADENLQITLAISLHAPNDNIRKSIMPVANEFTIDEILDACRYYINKTGRRITFEYALISNINDRESDALELCRKLKGMLCHVNLIPVNEIKEVNFKKSQTADIQKFTSILKHHGIETTIRREMGSDISAACGQLKRRFIEDKLM